MNRTVCVIGAPTDFGANQRGVEMGPSVIRYVGFESQIDSAGRNYVDGGDLRTPVVDGQTADTVGHLSTPIISVQ